MALRLVGPRREGAIRDMMLSLLYCLFFNLSVQLTLESLTL